MKYINGKNISLETLGRDIKWRAKLLQSIKNRLPAQEFSGKRLQCPICNHNTSTTYIKLQGSKYNECKNCGHLFVEDIISEDILDIYYANTPLSSEVSYIGDELFEKRIQAIAIPKVNFVSEHIPSTIRKKWLDIGCGGCELLAAAKKMGFSVVGVEPGSLSAQQGSRHGIPIHNVFITKKNAKDYIGDASIISLIGVLEHMQNPAEILFTLVENCSSETYFVIEVPRHPSLTAFTQQLFPDSVVRHFNILEHIHIFTEKSIEITLNKCGLEPLVIWRFGQDFYELLSMATQQAAQKKPNENVDIEMWPEELFNSINDVQHAIDAHNLSDSMLIIACSAAVKKLYHENSPNVK